MSGHKVTAPVPTVGRIVHYYTEPAGEQRAAIISAVDGEVVTLHVLNPLGVFVLGDVDNAPVPTPGHWSWPDVAPTEGDEEGED